MGKRFAIVVGVAAAGVMALGAAAIAGQTVKVDSKVTLGVGCAHHVPGGCDRVRIHGRVESSKHACEARRTVKYFSGHGLVGKDRTNNDGKWQLLRNPNPGFYHATVVRREIGTAGTTFVCRHDRTATFDFH